MGLTFDETRPRNPLPLLSLTCLFNFRGRKYMGKKEEEEREKREALIEKDELVGSKN